MAQYKNISCLYEPYKKRLVILFGSFIYKYVSTYFLILLLRVRAVLAFRLAGRCVCIISLSKKCELEIRKKKVDP